MFEFRLENITKKFTHKVVLHDVSISFLKGEIHSLLGENGAGKSTLAAILTGSVQSDSGHIFRSSKEIAVNSVRAAMKNGIGMVHQHPKLANELPLWQNIILGREPCGLFGFLNRAKAFATIGKLSRDWGIDVPLHKKTAQSSTSDRFYTALLASLYKNPRLLILDEPSAILDPTQRRFFYKALSGAVSRGLAVFLITHNIEEAIMVSDKISVLTRGIVCKTLANKPRPVSPRLIQRLMFEDRLPTKITKTREDSRRGKTALLVRNLKVKAFNGVTISDGYIEAHSGDITVISSKNSAELHILEDILTGMYEHPYFGTISVRGKRLEHLTSAEFRANKTALVPSNKVMRASNPAISVYEMLVSLRTNDRDFARSLIKSENIAIGLDEKTSHLSGGMLQRLALAREFAEKPKLVILAEPAAGLDRKSEFRLWESLRDTADSGCAVVVLTGDIEVVQAFCNKLYVIENATIKAVKRAK